MPSIILNIFPIVGMDNEVDYSEWLSTPTIGKIKRHNLFVLRPQLICFEQIFIWFKNTFFKPNKFYLIQINHFFKSKKVFQKNNFLWFNQIFSLSVVKLFYVHGEKWMFNYGAAILYVQLYYLDVQL